MTEQLSSSENENIQQSNTNKKTKAKAAAVNMESALKETKSTNNADQSTNKKKNTTQQKQTEKASKSQTPISKLTLLSILLTLGLGGGIYYYERQQNHLQQQTINHLQAQLDTLSANLQKSLNENTQSYNQQLEQLQQQIKQQSTAQQQFIAQVTKINKTTEHGLYQLQEQLSALSTSNYNNWLISQANYLVNLAGRKIWNEQDFVTASLLLKSADHSLAETNDPSLLPARQAINKDISSLLLVSHIDVDGVIMSLMELANQANELPLINNYQLVDIALNDHDDSFVDPTNDAPQQSEPNRFKARLKRWGDNLLASSKSLLKNFISIEKYNEYEDCIARAKAKKQAFNQCQVHKALIMPDQALYIRENIRQQLYIAAQAVPRHQDKIYQQALKDVSSWVYAYFNTDAPITIGFIDQLDRLQEQTINQRHLPEQLESSAILERLMQTRVRSLLSEQ
jgi:uroporphyrin-III C-methyltransferase